VSTTSRWRTTLRSVRRGGNRRPRRVHPGDASCYFASAARVVQSTACSPLHSRGSRVQLDIIALNLLYAVAGVVLMFVSYRVIDRLTPRVDFPEELKKGNVAVGIVIAAIFISIAMIIGHALN